MKKINVLIICLFLFANTQLFSQNITVDESFTPQQLVEDILVNSDCIVISNVTVSGGNFPSGEKTFGYFNKNGSIFNINEGIILSTGKVVNAPGPNNDLLDDGGDISWPGDVDLNTALNLSNSFNATVLEFDFVPLGSTISFDFLLSSEQYLTNPSSNQCNFTDGFAFLLREVGTTAYQNLAVVPGTSIPIKVNTIRGSGTICPPANEAYFDAFNGDIYPTDFNGQTKVLTAQSTVVPGTQYHIKLVVADEGNFRYDSAIFLAAGSFKSGIDLGEDRLFATNNPICDAELPYILDGTSVGATNYQWLYNDLPIVGEINPTLNITTPQDGKYSVNVTYSATCVTDSDIQLEFAPALTQDRTSFTKCDAGTNQDGITVFDATDFGLITANLFVSVPSSYQINYFDSPTATTPITIPYTNTTAFSKIIYARITNIDNCYGTFPVELIVNAFTNVLVNETFALCSNTFIDLVADSGFVSYEWDTVPTQNTQSITVNTPGTYNVIIENAQGCFKTKTFIVVGSQIATINDVIVNDFVANNSATVSVTGTGNYEYSLDGINFQDSPFFDNLTPDEYTVYVRDENGCGIETEIFYVLDYPKFFTPNNDGYNDTWQIVNLDKRNLQNSTIYIFDRYGKLIKQISPVGNGWNGILNGVNLPASDYWFTLETETGKTVKGHFSLKR